MIRIQALILQRIWISALHAEFLTVSAYYDYECQRSSLESNINRRAAVYVTSAQVQQPWWSAGAELMCNSWVEECQGYTGFTPETGKVTSDDRVGDGGWSASGDWMGQLVSCPIISCCSTRSRYLGKSPAGTRYIQVGEQESWLTRQAAWCEASELSRDKA